MHGIWVSVRAAKSAKQDQTARLSKLLTLNRMTLTSNDPRKKALENIAGKGENADDQHFLLFPQCFLPFQNQISFLDIFEF